MTDLIVTPNTTAQELIDDLVARARELARAVQETVQEDQELAEHMTFTVGAFLGFVSGHIEDPQAAAQLLRDFMPQITGEQEQDGPNAGHEAAE